MSTSLFTIERTFQGAWRVSTVVNDQLVTRQYMGYSRREALQLFTNEIKELAS